MIVINGQSLNENVFDGPSLFSNNARITSDEKCGLNEIAL